MQRCWNCGTTASASENNTTKGAPIFDILRPDSHYPIFSRICGYLPIGAIISLTQTCKTFSSLYQNLLPLQWNIDRTLRRFVRDPQALRSQMAKCEALISGSVALQFFERVVWPESDLDIYVEHGSHAKAFRKYIKDCEGYKFTHKSNSFELYPAFNIVKVGNN